MLGVDRRTAITVMASLPTLLFSVLSLFSEGSVADDYATVATRFAAWLSIFPWACNFIHNKNGSLLDRFTFIALISIVAWFSSHNRGWENKYLITIARACIVGSLLRTSYLSSTSTFYAAFVAIVIVIAAAISLENDGVSGSSDATAPLQIFFFGAFATFISTTWNNSPRAARPNGQPKETAKSD